MCGCSSRPSAQPIAPSGCGCRTPSPHHMLHKPQRTPPPPSMLPPSPHCPSAPNSSACSRTSSSRRRGRRPIWCSDFVRDVGLTLMHTHAHAHTRTHSHARSLTYTPGFMPPCRLGESRCAASPGRGDHCEKIAPHFCPGRSNGSLGLNAKGPLGRPGASKVGTLPGRARARGPGPMPPRCLAQIVTPAYK